MPKQAIQQAYLDGVKTLNDFVTDPDNIDKTVAIAQDLAAMFQADNKALICGNGGSCCDAMHFAEEFTGRYRDDRRALPVIALADPSHLSCVGNDYGFDAIFSRGVEAYGQAGDWLFGLSTSGNSPNIIAAFEKAKAQGMKTVALLGKGGGKLKDQCDYQFIVPASTSDRIQEIHMMILHIVIEGVERILFPENYTC
jgi:D-sedoheptulose 7-phosphate isomerase